MPWVYNIATAFRFIATCMVMLTLNACDGVKTKISMGMAAGSSADPSITSTNPTNPKAGDTVTLIGRAFPTRAKNLIARVVLTSNDTADTELSVTGVSSANFKVPTDIALDIKTILIVHDGKTLASYDMKEAEIHSLDPVVFTPPEGVYADAKLVTITSPNPNVTIYYTTDGSTPTTSSAVYTGAISVTEPQTIKAYAVRYGFNDSPSVSAGYVINSNVETPTFSVAAGSYGPAQSIGISTATPGATIYYTTDGSTPTTAAQVYSTAITVSSTQTIKAFATKTNYPDSAVASADYIITGAVQTPVATVPGGSYSNNQSVTLATVPVAATIYYTTDGSTPTTASTLYTGTISINGTTALKALGVMSNYTDSGIMTETYTLTAATPTADIAAGAYGPAQTVTLTSATTGGTPHYTTDGSTPTCSSPTGTVSVSTTMTVKAITCKANYSDSAVASFDYTINGAVATPTFSVAAGAYGPTQSVTLSTSTAGATIYYTTDDSAPTTGSDVYSSAITVSSTQTIKAFATKPDHVDSAVAPAAYTINGAAATPTFSVAAGAYGPAQSVTLSTATAGATIYYTTDDSTPTTGSSLYTSAINISSSQTVKAIATKPDYSDSEVAAAAYTINGAVEIPVATVAGGAYNNDQSVILATVPLAATIYYTTDGTAPTTGSTLYSGTITISGTTTLKAIAVMTDYLDSGTMTETYTMTAATPTADIAPGAYSSTQTVTLTSATTGADVHYTTNGTPPNCASATGSVSVSATMTLKAIACKDRYADSEVANFAYTINGTTAAPSFTVTSYTNKTVQITSATAGASIYYTTDNSTPTTSSTLYTAPFSITADHSVKAIATKSGLADSSVTSYDFNFDATRDYNATNTKYVNNFRASDNLGAWRTPGGNATILPAFSSTPPGGSPNSHALYAESGMGLYSNSSCDVIVPDLGSDFTIEMWVNIETLDVAGDIGRGLINGKNPEITLMRTDNQDPLNVYINEDFSMTFTMVKDSDYGNVVMASSASNILQLHQWHHIALQGKSGVSTSLFVDGAIVASTNQSPSGSTTCSPYEWLNPHDIGMAGKIYVSNMRMTQAARYGAAFTPTFINFASNSGPTVADPAFTVTNYTAKTLQITSTTPGASIYYTTDNSTPSDASTLYVNPISILSTQTLKAIAIKNDYSSQVTHYNFNFDSQQDYAAANVSYMRHFSAGDNLNGWHQDSDSLAVISDSPAGNPNSSALMATPGMGLYSDAGYGEGGELPDLTRDFTIEMWLYVDSFLGGDQPGYEPDKPIKVYLLGHDIGYPVNLVITSDRGVTTCIDCAQQQGYFDYSSSNASVIKVGKWQHIALVGKAGIGLKTFVDGVEVNSINRLPADNGEGDAGSPAHLVLFAGHDREHFANTFISNIRMSQIARYDSAFTPKFVNFGN